MILRNSNLLLSWFLLTLFFLSHYIIRVSPALLSIDFIKDFNIFPSKVSFISSSYFLIYTLAQLPAAYLLKYFSHKKIVSTAALCCGACSIGIALTSSFNFLAIYYLLFSFFSASAFLCSVSFASQHLPQYESFLLSLTPTLGMAAGFMSTNFLATALLFRPWREVMLLSSSAFFITATLVALFSTTSPVIQKAQKNNKQSKNYGVFFSSQTWLNAIFIGATYFPIMLIIEGGIGPSLLKSIHTNCTPNDISFGISLVFTGWMIAGPISGLIINKYGPFLPMSIAAASGAILSYIILYIPLSPQLLNLTLFLFGATNTGLLGSISLAAKMHGKNNAALSLAITNMAMTLIGAFLCGILPTILEFSSHPILENGIPSYSASAYQSVFQCMITIPLAGMFFLILMQTTLPAKTEPILNTEVLSQP